MPRVGIALNRAHSPSSTARTGANTSLRGWRGSKSPICGLSGGKAGTFCQAFAREAHKHARGMELQTSNSNHHHREIVRALVIATQRQQFSPSRRRWVKMRRSAGEVDAYNDRLPARTDPRSSIVRCHKMMFRSRTAQITIFAAGSAVALITATAGDSAHGEGNLDASYTVSFARIPVGEITATAVFGESEYAMSARARAGGVLKALLVDGEASFSTQGTIKGGHPVPTTFTSKIVSNTETSDVTMVLDEGNVKELATTPPPSSDRVPVTNSNRQGIVDPLTALLFSAAAAGEGLFPEACRHTLPIFDGHHRYDLKLRFKRMDKVTAEKGYAGPVVVCSVNY